METPKTLVKHLEQEYTVECSRCPNSETVRTNGLEAPHLFAASYLRRERGWKVIGDFPVCPECQKTENGGDD